MSEQNELQQLLRKGIEAAREGNKETARQFFQQVVDKDENNERGWYWLASVVETDDEKRVCLSNVLFINPDNEKAQKAMAQLEAKARQTKADSEVIPGVTRRQITLIAGGGGAVIVVLLLIVTLVTSSRNAQQAADNAAATALIAGPTMTSAAMSVISTGTAVAEATLFTPTPSPTSPPLRTPVPTFTDAPTTAPLVTPTPLPPPSGLTGRLVGWGGRDFQGNGFLPIVIYPLDQPGAILPLSDMQGRNVDISADGQRVVFTRYFAATFDFGIGEITSSGTDAKNLSQGLAVIQPEMPNFCKVANMVTFVGIATGERPEDVTATVLPLQVFTLNLDTNELLRITNDRSLYTYPAFSPDCTRVAVIKNDITSPTPGTDIVVIDVTTLQPLALTSDLGTFTEEAPRWSPDGSQIVYAAASVTDPNNFDIVVRPSDGSGTPLLPVRDPAADRFPVFSPNGNYLAFASNRSGFYDIYIFDQANQVLSQLTSSEDVDFPGGWWSP